MWCHMRICLCVLLQQMSVLDKLHAALAEEKRIEGLRAQAEAAVRPSLSFSVSLSLSLCPSSTLWPHTFRFVHLHTSSRARCVRTVQRPKPKAAKIAFKSNTRDRRRDYARESLLASEESPRSIGADGSPILQVSSGLLKHNIAYMY